MRDVEKYVSTLIKEQFPDFYHTEGPDFIQFVKAYFQWLEQSGNYLNDSRSLFEIRDIDGLLDTNSVDEYLQYFQNKYMQGLPKSILGDKQFLQKHILDLYRSKGSIEGLKLLFRLLYNEDVDVYIPARDILRASDGKWIERQYLEVSYSEINGSFEGKVVTGESSGATALVNVYEERIINDRRIYILFITDDAGQFQTGEFITHSGITIGEAPYIVGSGSTFVITGSDPGHEIGEEVTIDSNTTIQGEGLKFVISGIKDSAEGIIEFELVDGGAGYSNVANISITTGTNTTGSGASFIITEFSNTSVFEYNNEIIGSNNESGNTYDSIDLSSSDYGFPATVDSPETINTIIGDALSFTNVTIGTISKIQTTNPGTNYDGGVNVTITDPYTGAANAIVTGTAIFGTGIATELTLVDSGFGYHTNNQTMTLYNTSNTSLNITGNLLLNGKGKSEGFWKNTDGFLNADKYLQDSFYYQEFSYEVLASRTLDRYANILKALIHPAGNQLFGKAVIASEPISTISVESTSITQS